MKLCRPCKIRKEESDIAFKSPGTLFPKLHYGFCSEQALDNDNIVKTCFRRYAEHITSSALGWNMYNGLGEK